MYRPVGESVASPYDMNYRNNEYKYSEVSTPINYYNPDAEISSTPGYYQPENDISTTDSYFHPITELTSTPNYYQHRESDISSTPNYYQHRDVETSTESNFYYKEPEASSTPNYYAPNTESSTAQNYYQRESDESSFINFYRRQPEVPVVGNAAQVNQEFVVGSVPVSKDYSLQIDGVGKSKSDFFSLPDTYEPEEPQKENKQSVPPIISAVNIDRVPIAVNPLAKSAELDNQPLYEDIEVTPAPLLVEHGPRLFGARTVRVQGASQRTKRQTEKTGKSISNDLPLDNFENEIGNFEDNSFKIKDLDATKKPFIPLETTNNTESLNFTTTTTTTTTTESGKPNESLDDLSDLGGFDDDESHGGSSSFTPNRPTQSRPNFDLFGFAKRLAEMKIRFGLTFLKKASENFARYIGRVQEKFNLEH